MNEAKALVIRENLVGINNTHTYGAEISIQDGYIEKVILSLRLSGKGLFNNNTFQFTPLFV